MQRASRGAIGSLCVELRSNADRIRVDLGDTMQGAVDLIDSGDIRLSLGTSIDLLKE